MPKKKTNEPSQEFLENKTIIEMRTECEAVSHKLRMDELEYKRQSEHLKHEQELTRGRIRTAEIRKTMLIKHGDRNR